MRLILFFGSISRNSFPNSGSNEMALGRMAQTDRHDLLVPFVALPPGRSRLSSFMAVSACLLLDRALSHFSHLHFSHAIRQAHRVQALLSSSASVLPAPLVGPIRCFTNVS